MAELMHESVWFDRPKYETAEAIYHKSMAEDHSGLVIEV